MFISLCFIAKNGHPEGCEVCVDVTMKQECLTIFLDKLNDLLSLQICKKLDGIAYPLMNTARYHDKFALLAMLKNKGRYLARYLFWNTSKLVSTKNRENYPSSVAELSQIYFIQINLMIGMQVIEEISKRDWHPVAWRPLWIFTYNIP